MSHTHYHTHHHHVEARCEVNRRLDALDNKLDLIQNRQENIMTVIDDLQVKAQATLAKVTSDTDIDNAIAKVVNDYRAQVTDLKAQLAAAIAAGNDPAKLQTLSDTLDAILAADTSNAKIVADAVTAGTAV